MHLHLQQSEALISRADAQKLGLANGDTVTLSQNGTSLTLPVRINRMVSAGTVLVPRNLAGRPAEKLLGPGGLYSPVSVKKG